jgi:hypothetical protein
VDDPTPLRLQSFRLRQDRKSRLSPQTLHPPRQFHTVLHSIETRHAPALHHTPRYGIVERRVSDTVMRLRSLMYLIQARSWRVPLLPTFCAAVTDM